MEEGTLGLKQTLKPGGQASLGTCRNLPPGRGAVPRDPPAGWHPLAAQHTEGAFRGECPGKQQPPGHFSKTDFSEKGPFTARSCRRCGRGTGAHPRYQGRGGEDPSSVACLLPWRLLSKGQRTWSLQLRVPAQPGPQVPEASRRPTVWTRLRAAPALSGLPARFRPSCPEVGEVSKAEVGPTSPVGWGRLPRSCAHALRPGGGGPPLPRVCRSRGSERRGRPWPSRWWRSPPAGAITFLCGRPRAGEPSPHCRANSDTCSLTRRMSHWWTGHHSTSPGAKQAQLAPGPQGMQVKGLSSLGC